MFIANSEIRRLPMVMDQLTGKSILSAGEAPDFARQGGMIGLLMEAERVQFEINPAAVENGRLKISSNVLALARSLVAR